MCSFSGTWRVLSCTSGPFSLVPASVKIIHFPLRVKVVFYAFALSLSSAAIKCFSLLSGIRFPSAFYIAGGIVSVVIFWLFFALMLSVMSWTDERT